MKVKKRVKCFFLGFSFLGLLISKEKNDFGIVKSKVSFSGYAGPPMAGQDRGLNKLSHSQDHLNIRSRSCPQALRTGNKFYFYLIVTSLMACVNPNE